MRNFSRPWFQVSAIGCFFSLMAAHASLAQQTPRQSDAAARPSAVEGIWLGTLQTSVMSLRVQIVVKSDDAGKESCSLDSLDQNALNIPCANVIYSGSDFSFEVPAVAGKWKGKISDDGKALAGTWTQGTSLPLTFERREKAELPPARQAVSFDAAIPPVSAEQMEEVLRRDLEKALQSGALAPDTGGGVAVGVVRNGVRRVFAFGTAKPDSIFEIGSITKTFTGLILAQMIEQGKVKANEPVRDLLPKGVVDKPQGNEITLLDLVTQHSGLPRLPDNFMPANPSNPYVDYRAANLYEFLGKHGVEKPANTEFLYSNLGLGLLGQALANRAKRSYAELLEEQITAPLGMKDTIVSLSPGQQRRFMQGYGPGNKPVSQWDLDALAGAGAIRSTAGDMLAYLQANLQPTKIASRKNSKARTLSPALARSHELQADAGQGMRIAFAWLHNTRTGEYWHNGGTGGFSSFAFFNPKENYAVIVLVNKTVDVRGSFADRLGAHIGQRLAGRQAISLLD